MVTGVGRAFVWRTLVVIAVVMAAGSTSLANATHFLTTDTYTYSGTPQYWTVPPGVASINVTITGATGGLGGGGSFGGNGSWGPVGYLSGEIPVDEGEVLEIDPGQAGTSGLGAGSCFAGPGGDNAYGEYLGGDGSCPASAYSGGGGGGAASIIVTPGFPSDVIYVAAGGGGGAGIGDLGHWSSQSSGSGTPAEAIDTNGEDGEYWFHWIGDGSAGGGGGGAPGGGGGSWEVCAGGYQCGFGGTIGTNDGGGLLAESTVNQPVSSDGVITITYTAATAPTAPTGVTAVAGDTSATVSWATPASNGGSPILGYVATANPGGHFCLASAPTTVCTVTGLTNGTPHTFTVSANNLVGPGTSSLPSPPVTPFHPDRTPPTITVSNMTVKATAATGAVVTYAPTVTDDVDSSPSWSCSPASGTTFAVGSTTVTCNASDNSSNSTTANFTVAVVDSTAPVITTQDVSAKATDPAGARVTFAPTAHDDVAPSSPTVSCNPASGSLFAVGPTTVTCQAQDAAGNKGTATFNVAVAAPVLTGDFNVSPTPLQYGLGYSISLTGVPTSAGGTATVTAAGNPVCTITFSAGAGSCTAAASSLSGTAVIFTTVFSGLGWQSSTVQHTVPVAAGTPAITVTAPAGDVSVAKGDHVTLSANVSTSGGTQMNEGTVVFTFGGSVACAGDVHAGVASCVAIAPDAGGYPVNATYSGTANWSSVHTSGPVVTVTSSSATTTTTTTTTTTATTTGAATTTATTTDTTTTDTTATTTDTT